MGKARKSMVIATLLLAALSSYVDLPRLNASLNLGDTLNAARVLDPVQHTRMLQRLNQLNGDSAAALQSRLDDGMQSLKLIGNTSLLQGVVPGEVRLPTFTMAEDDQRITLGDVAAAQPLTAIPGAALTLDLPPPRFESLFQPPTLETPSFSLFSQTARAPPLALR